MACFIIWGQTLLLAATSVSYFNDLITFHFSSDYPVGKFANGDYWVHNYGASVVVNGITPASQNTGSRIINGTMINPPDSTSQGYDSSPRDMSYNNSLNVDPGNTGVNLVVPAGTSVVKSISMASDDGAALERSSPMC